MSEPLQNRVTPFGEIVALSARGTMMGNRGGRLHDDHKRLRRRRWASKAWICCELHFKGWHREVMAPRNTYTELFFLDEVTALAAGHRPCFECRRADAKAFAAAFPEKDALAGRMDEILHAERLAEHRIETAADLPDGAVWADDREAFTRREGGVLRWSPEGWREVADWQDKPVRLLTPPAVVTALRNGFEPRWHR
ncbi:hypothetical protein GCM10007874_00470 [Labrys miyagiensis]|uniref:Uncharacterized protein n=1 Tax=Labrys miyagiensis TaxID=346912 RepID=A0ABQ6CBL1_9HYPH|nr:hypothetical protein [Labrys miyagiensis]GLS17032.1 hypothetical protein GCM10007874_00470 [Labrys miyagiensis]